MGEVPALQPAGVRAAGALHVHTRRSHDALGSEGEVAEAARAAGLDFVMISDHRPQSAPESDWQVAARQDGGVLLLRGQEISLGDAVGRVLAFGLDTTMTGWTGSPDEFGWVLYNNGATAVVAHARSPRTDDSWRPGETPGIVGWEVFDLADVGRVRLADHWVVYHLLSLAASVPIGRAHQSLLRLYRRGFEQPHVAAFDSLYASGPITALGGLDAHPKTRIGDGLVPPYEPFFKSIVNHVDLRAPLPPDAAEAAAAITTGIRAGSVFISFGHTGLARNFVLFLAAPGGRTLGPGWPLNWQSGLVLRAGFWGGPTKRLLYRVMRDGATAAWVSGAELAWPVPEPGSYRVEVYRYTLRLGPLVWNLRPWIFANPNRVLPAVG
jgi:hypothetical protein